MDLVVSNINENWRFYTVCLLVLSFATLWWLSKYFASKKDLESHKNKFNAHVLEHYKLRDLVHEIDGHVKHLPTAQDSQYLREQMARLEGRLESIEPMFKQIVNMSNMLIENELRGEKR